MLPRPYLQRIYPTRFPQQQSPIARGMAIGKELGTDVGTVMQAIQQSQENQRMNDVANQLLNQAANTQNPPRAALVSPGTAQYDPVSDVVAEEGLGDQFQIQTPGQPNVIPQGVSTTGTAPYSGATGGVAELKLRQAFQQQQLANQLNQLKAQDYLSRIQGTGAYAPKPPKPVATGPSAAQQAISERMAQNQAIKQAHLDQKANTDSVAKVYQDFDKIHGKGQAAEVYTAIAASAGYRGSIVHDAQGNQHWVGDANGPLFTLDPRAAQNGPIDKDFQYYNMDELNSYYGRLQNVLQKGSGGVYTPALRAQPVGVPGSVPATTPPPLAATDSTGATATDTSAGTDTTGTDTTGTDTSGDTAQADLFQPTTLADYNSIPTGSLFIDGDGLTKRKYT